MEKEMCKNKKRPTNLCVDLSGKEWQPSQTWDKIKATQLREMRKLSGTECAESKQIGLPVQKSALKFVIPSGKKKKILKEIHFVEGSVIPLSF